MVSFGLGCGYPVRALSRLSCHGRLAGDVPVRNQAAVLHGVDDLRLDERPIPVPAAGELLIAVGVVGICGSDVHYLKCGRIGPFIVNAPMVLGHESGGTVVEVGAGVTAFQVGDRVAIEPGVPCRTCAFCKCGRYNLCADVRFLATPPIDGSMAGFMVHAADFCYRLPDHVQLEEAAMLEPLSVGVHACRRGGVGIGSKVLVTGAGPIGLTSLLAAHAAGADYVAVTDLVEGRLNHARRAGADATTDASSVDATRELAESVGGFHVAIDCSGAESAVRDAIAATRSGGKVVLVGMGADELTLPIVESATREVDLLGVFRYANTYPTALSMVASRRVDVASLITDRYPLEEVQEAFRVAGSPSGATTKVVVEIA